MRKPHKKIALDARMLYATGIGRYIRHLIDELQEIDGENDYFIIIRPQDSKKLSLKKKNFRKIKLDAPIYSLAEQTRLPKLLRGLSPDLVHFPSFNSPVFYPGKRITTVHDLTLVDFSVARGNLAKRLSYKVKRAVLSWQIKAVLKKSSCIITDTEYVRRQLAQRGIAPFSRIEAVMLGVPLERRPAPKSLRIGQPFLLYVGNFYPYKNLLRLVHAVAMIARDQPEIKLALVGEKDEFEAALVKKADLLGVRKNIIFTGFVKDSELAWLYQNATAYVFPSLSEGFGLPGLEAMQYGLPVASSNATCLPEVYGDAAVYFDPADTADMARVIKELINNPELREDLAAKGREQVKKYSWRRMAEETLEVYKKALKD